MDIHRCRFVPYPTSAINALAFSHASTPNTAGLSPPSLRLALGRANGDIEIWNPLRGSWYQESILRGGKDRSIEGLAWTHDLEEEGLHGKPIPGKLRLFSIGYSTVITEWDLSLGKPLRHSSGNYGEIWCLAAQPRWQAPKKATAGTPPQVKEGENRDQHLVVGCADGTLVLHSTADGDLRFLRTLARSASKKSRVLCVTFLSRGLIVAGYADSSIRVFSILTGKQISIMSLNMGSKGGPSEVLVWSVKCLPNGIIVSGDSTGEVKFWDVKTFTLLQRIQSHKADILDITASADGMTVFSGGMDRRTTVYRQMGGAGKGELGRWAEVAHQRFHSHDVKTMAVFESQDLSVVASGGLDTSPIIIPVREFGREHARTLPAMSHLPPLQSASSIRLLMSWWGREVRLWRVAGPPDSQRDKEDLTEEPEPGARRLIARVVVQGEENLTSASLASDGSMLAVSTISNIKVFRLRPPKVSTGSVLKVRKMELSKELACSGAKTLQFSPDSKWLAVFSADNSIRIFRILSDETTKGVLKLARRSTHLIRRMRMLGRTKAQYGSHGTYERIISRIAFSADSRILAIADLAGFLDTWVLEGDEDLTQEDDADPQAKTSSTSDGEDNEDSDEEDHPVVIFGQRWISNRTSGSLPKLSSAPLVLCFRPAKPTPGMAQINGNTAVHPTRHNSYPHSQHLRDGEYRLFVLTAQHDVYEFDVLKGKLSDWSRRNPSVNLPSEFKQIRDRAMGAIWDVRGDKERIWLYGSSWLFMFDLSKDFPVTEAEDASAVLLPTTSVDRDGAASRKRKRSLGQSQRRDLEKHDTGAGSKIPNYELDLGLSEKFRKFQGAEDQEARWIDMGPKIRLVPDDGDDDDEEEREGPGAESALVSLRRGLGNGAQSNGHPADLVDIDGEVVPDNHEPSEAMKPPDGPAHWHTFKYRPILGIVPLGGEYDSDIDVPVGGDNHEQPLRGLEVALVERPLWEVDLPARFYGDQEWNK